MTARLMPPAFRSASFGTANLNRTKGKKIMGLDMYALALDEPLDRPVEMEIAETEPLHYWRKHPNLHGWMRNLYFEKGGTDKDFNCAPLQLTVEDLDRLEEDVRNSNLPFTEGFFFGASQGDETPDDLKFIAKARAALAEGLILIYSAWW